MKLFILLFMVLMGCGTNNKVSGGTKNEVVITVEVCIKQPTEYDRQRCMDILAKLVAGGILTDDEMKVLTGGTSDGKR